MSEIQKSEIRKLREEIGFSQNQLARYFGVPKTTFLQWDQGKNKPAPYVIEMMKKVLRYEGVLKDSDINMGTNTDKE